MVRGDGFADTKRLEGVDAVVHLAGASVNGLRWTDERRRRSATAAFSAHGISSARSASLKKNGQRYWSPASAIGFYGERADEEITESSRPATRFSRGLKGNGRARRAVPRSRDPHGPLRTGIVLSKGWRRFGTMLLPFKLGVGGVVGSGKQWMSWISSRPRTRESNTLSR